MDKSKIINMIEDLKQLSDDKHTISMIKKLKKSLNEKIDKKTVTSITEKLDFVFNQEESRSVYIYSCEEDILSVLLTKYNITVVDEEFKYNNKRYKLYNRSYDNGGSDYKIIYEVIPQ